MEFHLSEEVTISETLWSDESNFFLTFEDAPVEELLQNLYVLVLEEALEIAEIWNVSVRLIIPPPELSVEFYTQPTALLSTGISTLPEFSPPKREAVISLTGSVERGQWFSHSTEVYYSVGIDHQVTTSVQRWLWGTERWEIIPFSSSFLWWLNGMFLRFVHVHNSKVFLILIPQDTNSRLLCRLVVVNAQVNPASVDLISDFWAAFPVNAGDTFGTVAVGHGFIAFCRLGDFILINTDTYEWESYRAIFLSSQYRKMLRPQVRHTPFIVPEGILLLPLGIFFDLETYYQLPNISLSENSDYAALEAQRLILLEIPKNRESGEATISRAYLWVSPSAGFERIEVDADLNLPPYAPWGYGTYWNNKWVAYGTDRPDLDERLLYFYYLEDNRLRISSAGYRNLPLSVTAQIFRYMPTYAQPYWLEMYFQTASNMKNVYTVRLWNRIYRLDLENRTYELATLVPVWNGNEYEPLTPEIPVQTLLSYDMATGQLYAVARYGHQNYLTLARQQDPISEPPAPINIVVNLSQRTVIFVPSVYAYPQEFVVSVEHTGANIKYELFSWKERRYWSVSYDGGANWQPMNQPVLRANPSDNIVVKVSLPQQLLRSTNYQVRVRAVTGRV